MTIALVDTSVFCEILPVPSKCTEPERYRSALRDKILAREHLLLPMATILETGNHVGQQNDGRTRRQAALKFVERVQEAIDGTSAFGTTPFVSDVELRKWLDEFPEWAKSGSGLGDLSIVKEWERQCDLHPSRRVYIWSKDRHLNGYDRKV